MEDHPHTGTQLHMGTQRRKAAGTDEKQTSLCLAFEYLFITTI